jgi:hypothetical protein
MSSSNNKKRGRPKKTTDNDVSINTHNNDKNVVNGNMFDKKEIDVDIPKEIILHLPIDSDDENQSVVQENGESDIGVKYGSSNSEIIPDLHTDMIHHSNGSEDDNNSNSSTSIQYKKLLKETKEKDKIINKLRSEINEYKNILYNTTDNSSYMPLDLKLINCKNGETIVSEKTNIACWWDTCEFDNHPFFIPENEADNKFYVFGCFCGPQCAAAYNAEMNDYKTKDRYSLIKKLNSIITNQDKDIDIAPPREILTKFGGTKTIEEYRKISKLSLKEYKIRMPPLVSIIPYIEEKTKDKNGVSLLAIKPAKNSNNNVIKATDASSRKRTLFDTMNGLQQYED